MAAGEAEEAGRADPSGAPAARRRFRLGARTGLLLAFGVVLVEAWAMASTDPDFYLPDPFRPLVIGFIATLVGAGWIRSDAVRRGVRVTAAMILACILVLEVRLRLRANDDGMVERTDDVLLRYRYRPGAQLNQVDASGARLRINHLGLMDLEHEIPKPKGVYRVLVLSGSIANDGDVPFEERFWRRLEQRLAGADPEGRRIEVVNVSVHGYSAVQQVRLLEQVGMRYEPDLVVSAHMLTAASVQNGGYRRLGNSFFLFRFLPPLKRATTGSVCSVFAPFHDEYSFELIVRNSFERLALLSREHGFRVLVAVLPVVEEFDDPLCARLYDKVGATARDAGLSALRVPDAFRGEPASRFTKPDGRWDVCHPNSLGHERIAESISDAVRALLAKPASETR